MPSLDKLKKAERVAWRFGGVEPFINFVVANRSEEANPFNSLDKLRKAAHVLGLRKVRGLYYFNGGLVLVPEHKPASLVDLINSRR